MLKFGRAWASRQMKTQKESGARRIEPRDLFPKVLSYWTVTLPFMFIARCGVQWKSYLPGFTPPKEMAYFSFGFIIIGLESSDIFESMFASSCALEDASVIVAGSNATL